MTTEERFLAAWKKRLDQAEALGVPVKRTQALLERQVPLSAAKGILRRGSNEFEALSRLGRLDLSLEALVLAPEFGSLFTDQEANACLEALLEAGYYEKPAL